MTVSETKASQPDKPLTLPEAPCPSDSGTQAIRKPAMFSSIRSLFGKHRKAIRRVGFSALLLLAISSALLIFELRNSRLQSRYLTRIAREASFTLGPGPSKNTWYPSFGPYDQRLGYTRIRLITENLLENGF